MLIIIGGLPRGVFKHILKLNGRGGGNGGGQDFFHARCGWVARGGRKGVLRREKGTMWDWVRRVWVLLLWQTEVPSGRLRQAIVVGVGGEK